MKTKRHLKSRGLLSYMHKFSSETGSYKGLCYNYWVFIINLINSLVTRNQVITDCVSNWLESYRLHNVDELQFSHFNVQNILKRRETILILSLCSSRR